jgi:hypothetical protein
LYCLPTLALDGFLNIVGTNRCLKRFQRALKGRKRSRCQVHRILPKSVNNTSVARGIEMLRCTQHDRANLSVSEELSRAFEPCLMKNLSVNLLQLHLLYLTETWEFPLCCSKSERVNVGSNLTHRLHCPRARAAIKAHPSPLHCTQSPRLRSPAPTDGDELCGRLMLIGCPLHIDNGGDLRV